MYAARNRLLTTWPVYTWTINETNKLVTYQDSTHKVYFTDENNVNPIVIPQVKYMRIGTLFELYAKLASSTYPLPSECDVYALSCRSRSRKERNREAPKVQVWFSNEYQELFLFRSSGRRKMHVYRMTELRRTASSWNRLTNVNHESPCRED